MAVCEADGSEAANFTLDGTPADLRQLALATAALLFAAALAGAVELALSRAGVGATLAGIEETLAELGDDGGTRKLPTRGRGVVRRVH
jgi:hypothetical protein